MKEYFDIAVIIPLEEELLEFMQIFPGIEDKSIETEFRYTVQTSVPGITMLVAQQSDWGKQEANKTASEILKNYDIGTLIGLGIAGSLSGDAKLGDVCYTGHLIDVYDKTKAINSEYDGVDVEFSPHHYYTPLNIRTALNSVRTHPLLKSFHSEWRNERRAQTAKILEHANSTSEIDRLLNISPTSMHGTIVCGAVSGSPNYNSKLRKLNRKVLAIETESGGVFGVGDAQKIPAIAIRGISDYADADKSNLENTTKNEVRKIAAQNASSFLKLQFNNGIFLRTLQGLRELHSDTHEQTFEFVPTSLNDISDVIADINHKIDEKLREVSPEYRTQPKGYKLPVPRIQHRDKTAVPRDNSESTPIEIRTALQNNQRVSINVPRTYPDRSLPWVIAADLLGTEISGNQVLPLIVDASLIRPPKFDFEYATDIALKKYDGLDGIEIVFIIENLPFSSKSRMRFLSTEIHKYGSCRCIFIDQAETQVLSETDFVADFGISLYNLCDVSFMELSHFIQANFDLNGTQSEVIALRLQDIFREFNLSAHPTYFACIPREVLSNLLQANRRSELIQLAVDGYLTFVVATDKADIALSRTTRSRFLRKLVLEKNVEKKKFSAKEIVEFTESFALEYDFDIDAIEFIQSFIDRGLLHYGYDSIEISLPFIESYLLALELSHDEDKALKYFDAMDADFDNRTFDLYAEIGPSEKFVSHILRLLYEFISEFEDTVGEIHILLTDEIRPRWLVRPEPVNSLQQRLKKLTEEVESGQSSNIEKQQILDIADWVRNATSDQRRKGIENDGTDNESHTERIELATQVWGISTILLGSGAEHLNAETKRGLARLLIRLTSLILDAWTRRQAATDFDDVREQVLTESAVEDYIAEHGIEDEDPKELRAMLAQMVDVLEQMVLSAPINQLISILSEQARHKVLGKSVQAAEVTDDMDRLIRGIWLADIDTKRGIKMLKEATKKLPNAPFFRSSLASILLWRVYWRHWDQKDRLSLLDVAEKLISSQEYFKIDKGYVKRRIEQNN